MRRSIFKRRAALLPREDRRAMVRGRDHGFALPRDDWFRVFDRDYRLNKVDQDRSCCPPLGEAFLNSHLQHPSKHQSSILNHHEKVFYRVDVRAPFITWASLRVKRRGPGAGFGALTGAAAGTSVVPRPDTARAQAIGAGHIGLRTMRGGS